MKVGAITSFLACMGLFWAQGSGAAQRVDNFTLLDQNGKSHKLHYLSDRKAVVIMVQGNGCPIVRAAWHTLKEIRADYAAKGIEFLMLNSNLQDNRTSIKSEASEFGYDIPILADAAQLVGEAMGVDRTAEVFVIETKSWSVVYRGPIDDRLTYERQRATAKEAFLTDALDNVLVGRPIAIAKRDAVGCIVNFPHREKPRAISYSKTVAPLLVKNCVGCHRKGGIAPWAMTSYAMVRGFAPMIREVLRTQRMPPWHADPSVGHWVGDRSLSPADMATLVHWVEAGAPRGSGKDPLESERQEASEWTLGEPDLVLTLPAFEVPATGVVSYQYPTVVNPLDKPVWVRAAVVLPGDRTVVHHILTGYTAAAGAGAGRAGGLGALGISVFESSLSGYVPGTDPHAFPEGTGVLIEPGGRFVLQIHYTPTGKVTQDVTRLGLYFHDKPPRQIMRNVVAVNPLISIAPNLVAYEDSAYISFDKPAIVYSLFPHAHYRGASSKFEIRYPDGRNELLLSVPRYDFNWQRDYVFEKPLEVPAGAKIIHTTVYDNSPQNPANPDPLKQVTWGEQSWEEMLYGGIRFRWRDETVDDVIHDPAALRVQQLFGYMDRNRDDGLEAAELPAALQRFVGPQLTRLDQDGNGKLSVAELSGAMGGRSVPGAPAR
jgi:hypothetical protein